MKKIAIVLLSFSATLTSATVLAEGDFYGSLNLVRLDIDSDFDNWGGTDTTFSVGVGYRLNENVAVELGYQDFGDVSISGNGSATIEADAIQLSVIGGLPVSENVGVYAELGFDLWDAKLSYTDVPGVGSGSDSDDGNDVYFGLGGYWSVNEKIAIHLDYQVHELDDTEIDTLGVGVSFTF